MIEGIGPRVVLVHGFTQTHVSWHAITADLVAGHEVVAVDAPGHGGSGPVETSLSEGAALLGEAGGEAVYVGYSMGGRLALRLALDRPDLVRGLVLLGATAGIDEAADRAARRAADGALADRIEREGVGAFLRYWLAQPMFAGLPIDPVERASRRRNTAKGLASSLRLAGTGTMDPSWWAELPGLQPPTLVLAGSRDQKFTDLGTRLAETVGGTARFATIDGAGHAAHLEAPGTFLATVRPFLTDRGGSAPKPRQGG